jgi:hypothetical protein
MITDSLPGTTIATKTYRLGLTAKPAIGHSSLVEDALLAYWDGALLAIRMFHFPKSLYAST